MVENVQFTNDSCLVSIRYDAATTKFRRQRTWYLGWYMFRKAMIVFVFVGTSGNLQWQRAMMAGVLTIVLSFHIVHLPFVQYVDSCRI